MAKFMIAVLILMAGAEVIALSITKVRLNPRHAEVQKLADPIVSVIRRYKREHGEVPLDSNALLAACELLGIPMHVLPNDPWGRPLRYVAADSEYHAPRVVSFGADGTEGGDGEDLDVDIWAGDP